VRAVRLAEQDRSVEAAASSAAEKATERSESQQASNERQPEVADLRPGQRFRGEYACARKDRRTARNGSPYLALELRDRSGTIPARLFRDVDRLSARFERGDAVRVAGKVERFRGELSAELEDVRRLEPGDADAGRFLPAAYRDRDELEGFLEHLIREVHDASLRSVVERLLFTGGIAEEFRRAPCTRAGHHSYLGGLLEHTVAVGTLVGEVRQLHPKLDSDLLMASALLHDVGKVREFTYGADFEISEEGRLLGHLAIGAEIVSRAGADLPAERRAALLHCILTHHGADAASGRRAFGSPEAVALYRLNALDAQVKGVLEHGL
jgi:3'-5' exoribonuclease